MDGDGDFDMIISNYATGTFRSAIHLYENTGTPAGPAFKLITKDYLFLSFSSFYNLKAQFADVNAWAKENGLITADLAYSESVNATFLP